MEINLIEKEIKLSKNLNKLDQFVLDFCSLLEDYVVVSGYVSILFGRSRATEDVDLLVPELGKDDFHKLWEKLHKNGFWCVNTFVFEDAFEMLNENAIRFAKKEPVPNIEFKMIKTDFDRYSFENRIKVVVNEDILFISPLEMQIAFKLFLAHDGTKEELEADKDVEDARHLYKLFGDKINKEELFKVADKLNVRRKLNWLK